MKPIDFVILGIIIVIAGFVLFKMIKKKKKGCSGGLCSGNCSTCTRSTKK